MSECAATPHDKLIAEICDSRVAKTEREHAAGREIERLRAQRDALAEALRDIADAEEEAFGSDDPIAQVARAALAKLEGKQ